MSMLGIKTVIQEALASGWRGSIVPEPVLHGSPLLGASVSSYHRIYHGFLCAKHHVFVVAHMFWNNHVRFLCCWTYQRHPLHIQKQTQMQYVQ